MLVRRGTLADLDFLVNGNAAMALETEALVLDPETLEAGVRAVLEGRVPGAYYVGQVEHERVAHLMVTYEWSDWRNSMVWWIQSVWVTPEARRRGYYGQLYRAVQAEARAAGAGGLRLYVDVRNTRAQAVYAALGMNGDHYRVFEAMERF